MSAKKKSTNALPAHAQLLPLHDYDRLWRCQMAVAMLAAITDNVAQEHGISHDSVAAVAEFIRDEMLGILNQSTSLKDLI